MYTYIAPKPHERFHSTSLQSGGSGQGLGDRPGVQFHRGEGPGAVSSAEGFPFCQEVGGKSWEMGCK